VGECSESPPTRHAHNDSSETGSDGAWCALWMQTRVQAEEDDDDDDASTSCSPRGVLQPRVQHIEGRESIRAADFRPDVLELAPVQGRT
jgi:hypothetical protein